MKKFYRFEKKDFKPISGMVNYFQRVLNGDNIRDEEVSCFEYSLNIISRGIILGTYNFALPTAVLVTAGLGLEKLLSK